MGQILFWLIIELYFILGGYRWLICDMSKISHLDVGAVDALHTASEQCKRKNVCFRIVIPDEKLHKKMVNGHIESETLSLTLGSALVQVGKSTVSYLENCPYPMLEPKLRKLLLRINYTYIHVLYQYLV